MRAVPVAKYIKGSSQRLADAGESSPSAGRADAGLVAALAAGRWGATGAGAGDDEGAADATVRAMRGDASVCGCRGWC